MQASDSANSFPMLEIPGWFENQRLPTAVAVHERAEKYSSRQSRLQKICFTGLPLHYVVNLKCNADPKESWQRDDVGIIECEARQGANFRVATAATRSGMRVNSTSAILRNEIQSKIAMLDIAHAPASMNAKMIVRPHS